MSRADQLLLDRCPSRLSQMSLDRSNCRKRPRLVVPSVVKLTDPPVLLRCERPVAMLDMDFMPRAGEMTLISDTGCTHILRVSDKSLRVFVGDSIRMVRLSGMHSDTVMCTAAGAPEHLRVNATATGHFGSTVAGGVVRGSVVLLRHKKQ